MALFLIPYVLIVDLSLKQYKFKTKDKAQMTVYLHDSHSTNKHISQMFIKDTRVSKVNMKKVALSLVFIIGQGEPT